MGSLMMLSFGIIIRIAKRDHIKRLPLYTQNIRKIYLFFRKNYSLIRKQIKCTFIRNLQTNKK